MHAQRLEIVHIYGTPNFATTVLALLPAQLLALVQAVLQAPGPSFGASTFAATRPKLWCRRYGSHPAPAMVQVLLQPPSPSTGAGVLAATVARTSHSTGRHNYRGTLVGTNPSTGRGNTTSTLASITPSTRRSNHAGTLASTNPSTGRGNNAGTLASTTPSTGRGNNQGTLASTTLHIPGFWGSITCKKQAPVKYCGMGFYVFLCNDNQTCKHACGLRHTLR